MQKIYTRFLNGCGIDTLMEHVSLPRSSSYSVASGQSFRLKVMWQDARELNEPRQDMTL